MSSVFKGGSGCGRSPQALGSVLLVQDPGVALTLQGLTVH